ncbi:MAG: MBOAT family protein [Oscillospiraceae bacterium]|nr:MBOAT family protein [Oscillospiraceae bacterium]
MLFSSIPFLFYFLPAVMIVYFLAPWKLKNAVLLLFSLIFYGWGEPKYLFLMIGSILAYYGCGLAMERWPNRKKLWMWLSVALGAALLGIFKYADFFIGSFNAVTGLSVPLLRLALPIGISFYTFQCLSYTIDVYRGNVPAQHNLLSFGAYVCLFPQLIAGPIVRYVDVARELNDRRHTLEGFTLGLRRFLVGLGKKVLIADGLALFIEHFRAAQAPSVLFYWLYALAFSLHIYFDFSGYSDMAIGLGRILGFRFLENFNYPYLSKSVTEFWRRWHMSLGSWFRDYVYIPLGGSRVSKVRWVLNILAVWMLTGLWHGASWNFVVWGLIFAVLLLAEKWLPWLKKLGSIYVLPVVMLSFVVFNAADLGAAVHEIGAMFGLAGLPLVTVETLYYLRSFAPLFVMAMVGATPIVRDTCRRIENTAIGAVLEIAMMAGLLIVCTAYLVDGSFSPFLYFRF